MHEHKECEHPKLKHCAKCDVVYCNSCKKEWQRNLSWTYTNCGTTTIPCNTVSSGTQAVLSGDCTTATHSQSNVIPNHN